jgi:hypothetical protein
MKYWLLACAALCSLVSTARAEDHWVSANALPGIPWFASVFQASPTTLDTANARAQAGDRVRLLPGDYHGLTIRPASSGTPAARIVFRGDPADTSAVHGIGSISLTTSDVTVEFVSGAGGVVVAQGADRDSVWRCALNSLTGLVLIDGNDFTLAECRITAATLHTCFDCGNAYPDPTHAFVMRTRLSRNVLDLHPSDDNVHAMRFLYSRFALLESNTVSLTIEPPATNTNGLTFYFSPGVTSRDNHYTIRNYGGPGCDAAVILRDSTWGCHFTRDTILVPPGSVPGHTEVRLAAHGSVEDFHNTCRNRFESLFVMNYPTDAVFFQDMPFADTLQGCVFASGTASAFLLNDDNQAEVGPVNMVFRHNTLYGVNSLVMTLKTSIADIGSVYRSNIVYSTSSPDCGSSETMARMGEVQPALADSNLYFSAVPQADSSFATQSEGGLCHTPSGFSPGSAWATPLFADSTWNGFDGSLGSGSWAVNSRWADGYVGARTGPPWPVRDLFTERTGNTTAVLAWTEPQRLGAIGATWELRRANSPIRTNADFQRATFVAQGAATGPGTPECLALSQLAPCTSYHFAVRIADAYGSSSVEASAQVSTRCEFASEVECPLDRLSVPVGCGRRAILGPSLVHLGVADASAVGVQFADEDQGRAYRLELFDLLGRRLATLAEGVAGARSGSRLEPLSTHGLRPGVAFLRLEVGGATLRRTLVLVP